MAMKNHATGYNPHDVHPLDRMDSLRWALASINLVILFVFVGIVLGRLAFPHLRIYQDLTVPFLLAFLLWVTAISLSKWQQRIPADMAKEFQRTGDPIVTEIYAHLVVHYEATAAQLQEQLGITPDQWGLRRRLLQRLELLAEDPWNDDTPSSYFLTDAGDDHAIATLRASAHPSVDLVTPEPDWSAAVLVTAPEGRGSVDVWFCTDCGRIFVEPAGLRSTNMDHWRDHPCSNPDIYTPRRHFVARYRCIPPVEAYEWLTCKQLKLRLGRDSSSTVFECSR